MDTKKKQEEMELMDEETLVQVAGGAKTALDVEMEKEMLSFQVADTFKSDVDKAAYDTLKQANPTNENILKLLG